MMFIIYVARTIAGLGVVFICFIGVLAIRELFTVHLKYKKNKRIIQADPVSVYGEVIDITGIIYSKEKPIIEQCIHFSYKAEDGTIFTNKEDVTIHVLKVDDFKVGVKLPLCYARTAPEMVIIDLPDIK